MEKKTAGVVGLGMIGGGIAVSLLNSGIVPVVYDIKNEVTKAFAGRANITESVKELTSQSDVIMLCVVNDKQAISVFEGKDGIFAANKRNIVVCLVATVTYKTVLYLDEECKKHGIGLIDCGVTPGYLADKNGMIAIVGGEERNMQFAQDVLEGWAKKIVYCGPCGSGMAVKLARNAITFGSWRIVKEAQRLVQAVGADYKKLAEVIDAADPNGEMLLDKLKRSDTDGCVPQEVSEKNLPLMIKDLKAAHALAVAFGVDMPATDITRLYANDTLDRKEKQVKKDREYGAEIAEEVYGGGLGVHMAERTGNLYNDTTLEQVFANVWGREGLNIHDRRLLVMGVAAAYGREDLIKTQALGALRNGELTTEQLQEISLQLAYYAGWCNGGSVAKGIEEAVIIFRQETGC